MNLNRREFIRLMGLASAAGMFPVPGLVSGADGSKLYDMPAFGNARILHIADCHAHQFSHSPLIQRDKGVVLDQLGSMMKTRLDNILMPTELSGTPDEQFIVETMRSVCTYLQVSMPNLED